MYTNESKFCNVLFAMFQCFTVLCKFGYSSDYENWIYLDQAKFVDKRDQVKPIRDTFKKR